MAKRTKHIVEPWELDVGEAQRAFERHLPDLEAIPRHEIQTARVDLQLAAAIACSVAVRDRAPGRRERLQRVAARDIFDISTLDRLPDLALCAWHVRRMQNEMKRNATGARVPPESVRTAIATRSRMLRVLRHYYHDDPQFVARIAAIRPRTGYLDLANDLLTLADLYDEQTIQRLISHDPRHYRADDPATARQHAHELFQSLGFSKNGEDARWTDLAQRAWTLLKQSYEELRAAGQLVFRRDEDTQQTYPSLVTAARAPRTSPSTAETTPYEPLDRDVAASTNAATT